MDDDPFVFGFPKNKNKQTNRKKQDNFANQQSSNQILTTIFYSPSLNIITQRFP